MCDTCTYQVNTHYRCKKLKKKENYYHTYKNE